MLRLRMFPLIPICMAGCDRCGLLKRHGEMYATEDGAGQVCYSCVSPEERQYITFNCAADNWKGKLGYLECAEKNVDHAGIAAARGKLLEIQAKLDALKEANP